MVASFSSLSIQRLLPRDPSIQRALAPWTQDQAMSTKGVGSPLGATPSAWQRSTVWRAGSQKQVAEHRRWMVRSFSLTYAAVTLRIYLAILPALPLAFVSGYRVVSFLCWVPNLVLAELLLRRGSQSARAGGISAFGQRPVSDSAA